MINPIHTVSLKSHNHLNKINMRLRFKSKSNNSIWNSQLMTTLLNSNSCFINLQLHTVNHPKLWHKISIQSLIVKSTCKKLLMKLQQCKISNLLKKRKIKIRRTEPLSNKSLMTGHEKFYWNSLTTKQFMKSMAVSQQVNKPMFTIQ